MNSADSNMAAEAICHAAYHAGEAFCHEVSRVGDYFMATAGCISTPSAIFKPRLFIDGDYWCALYGENLQDGVAGFGVSPKEAMDDFDAHWGKKLEVIKK